MDGTIPQPLKQSSSSCCFPLLGILDSFNCDICVSFRPLVRQVISLLIVFSENVLHVVVNFIHRKCYVHSQSLMQRFFNMPNILCVLLSHRVVANDPLFSHIAVPTHNARQYFHCVRQSVGPKKKTSLGSLAHRVKRLSRRGSHKMVLRTPDFFFEPLRFGHHPISTRRPPERDRTRELWAGEGKNSAILWTALSRTALPFLISEPFSLSAPSADRPPEHHSLVWYAGEAP